VHCARAWQLDFYFPFDGVAMKACSKKSASTQDPTTTPELLIPCANVATARGTSRSPDAGMVSDWKLEEPDKLPTNPLTPPS